MAERVPPGRAGILWLTTRLAAAHRGRDLLDHKHQLLRREQQKLSVALHERRQTWQAAIVYAQRWSLRAGVLDGTSAKELFTVTIAGNAQASITWGNTMGVRHPASAQCDFPALAPSTAIAGSSSLLPTAQACRKALEAAVNMAVTATALQKIENELKATQRRLSGIEHHQIPRLAHSLINLQFRVEEIEREEGIVARWAHDRQQL